MSLVSPLKIKSAETAAADAKLILEEERDGRQRGLLCRFKNLNMAMLKWWRFGLITQIASPSGGGKSYLLNMLIEDFTDEELNGNFYGGSVVVLCFSFEMRASDELLRTTSRKMQKSYKYLRSSAYDESKGTYNTLTDMEFNDSIAFLDKFAKRKILYVETSGNLGEIEATIDYVANKYPNANIVTTFDHALLVKRFDEGNEVELIANLAGKQIEWTKTYNLMSIILGQCNANIEQPIRRENNFLHYPIKSDIHGSNQMYMACDNVLVAHRPKLLKLEKYGPLNIVTKDLMHGALIKGRFAGAGNLWFKDELDFGRFSEYTIEERIERGITKRK